MALSDTIGDMITRIRNGQRVNLARVAVPSSNIHKAILEVLKKEGYIKGFASREVRKGIEELDVELAYYQGQPVIKKIKRISKPGLRQYAGSDSLPRIANGLGVAIISTPKGVMADHEARASNVGGELICSVF